jgi:hypothetical protein
MAVRKMDYPVADVAPSAVDRVANFEDLPEIEDYFYVDSETTSSIFPYFSQV